MPDIPPCGPERDRAVAEMLGCTTWDSHDDGTGWWGCFCERPQSADIFPHDAAMRCSTSPAAAFEALEMWVAKKAGRNFMVMSPGTRDTRWLVRVSDPDVIPGNSYDFGSTFPDAATAALLRAGT